MIQIDEIGALHTDAVMDGETVVTPAQALPGWHVNATHVVAGWDAWRVTPGNPRRVFGGGTTVFYTFASKAEFDAALEEADLTEPPLPPVVPQSVTMRQARLALMGAGKLAAVNTALDALPEPQKSAAKIEWEYSNELHRNRELVQALAPALGLTGAQIDALFIQAATL